MLRTESEIIEKWEGDIEKPVVSISCTAYNQIDYIEDAIESFLSQETTFPFEILIHDDASTDGTSRKIKYYEERYPKLIKVIYQKENQYSKGVKVGIKNRERALGEFIALCEGDDYWTNPLKLQKQVSYMQSHPNTSLCVHAGVRIDHAGEKLNELKANRDNKIFSVDEIILGTGGLFITCSMLFRKEVTMSPPYFYLQAPAGDYALTMWLATLGDVYYMKESMGAYRFMSKGSWSKRVFNIIDQRIKHDQRTIEMLEAFDVFTEGIHREAIDSRINEIQFKNLLIQGKFSKARAQEYVLLRKKLGFKGLLKARLKFYLNRMGLYNGQL